jgi:hypothetical protein
MMRLKTRRGGAKHKDKSKKRLNRTLKNTRTVNLKAILTEEQKAKLRDVRANKNSPDYINIKYLKRISKFLKGITEIADENTHELEYRLARKFSHIYKSRRFRTLNTEYSDYLDEFADRIDGLIQKYYKAWDAFIETGNVSYLVEYQHMSYRIINAFAKVIIGYIKKENAMEMEEEAPLREELELNNSLMRLFEGMALNNGRRANGRRVNGRRANGRRVNGRRNNERGNNIDALVGLLNSLQFD